MRSKATTSTTLQIPALDCPDELSLIEKGLRPLEGIVNLSPDYLNRRLIVEHESRLEPPVIAAELRQLGFATQVESPTDAKQEAAAPLRVRRDTLGGAIVLLLAFAGRLLFAGPSLGDGLAVAATLIAGVSVARAALRALRLRAIDMNVLMTLAAIGALAGGDYFEAATAMVLFGIAIWLEGYSLGRARRAVRSLVELTPPRAHRYAGASLAEVDAALLVAGDRVLVKPGERLPVDGEIEEGASAVNQAPITGEALPVEKRPGDAVYAGSVNGEGSLVIRASQPAAESTLAHIARLVEEAQRTRSPTERFVDRFARYYTPAVIGLAVALVVVPLAAGGWQASWALAHTPAQWLHRALVLLVIACPCALVISTPVTIVCGLHAAARAGILIKGGEFLERAGKVEAIAFDKTGTLTQGAAEVTRIVAAPGVSDEELLRVAAALESRSEHPLAQAVVSAAQHRQVSWQPAEEVVALRGLGVQGRIDGETWYVGNAAMITQLPFMGGALRESVRRALAPLLDQTESTVVLVTGERRFLGALALTDRPRPDAAAALRELRGLGVRRLILLSGDRKAVVRQVARELGLDEFHADLLPRDKVEQIKTLSLTQPRLAMVGDGVNDAPALASSWLGIAFGSGASDTALETADVVVLSPQVALLPRLIELGRRTRRILIANIVLSLGLKVAVLAVAVVGPAEFARLWLAVAADVGATLLVVANGMRLLRSPPRRGSR